MYKLISSGKTDKNQQTGHIWSIFI